MARRRLLCLLLALTSLACTRARLQQGLAEQEATEAVAELRGDQLVVSGLRFEGQLRAFYLPGSCAGKRPADCSEAEELDYDLAHAGDAWALTLTPPQQQQGHWPRWHKLRSVTVWCEEGCEFLGSAAAGGGPNAAAASLPVLGARKPCPFARGAAGSSVALVLSGPRGQAQQQPQLQRGEEGMEGPGRVARRLQAAACELSVGGTVHSFAACSSVSNSNAPYTLYYSLAADASGAAVLRGGMRAAGVGWAGWGLGTTRMSGASVTIVKTDATAASGASVAGYLLPRSYSASAINAAQGTWALTEASAALENGALVATFTATLPLTAATLATSPTQRYIWATGSMSSSVPGSIREHSDYSSASLTLPTPTAAGSPAPAPAGSPSPAVAQSPAVAVSPVPALPSPAPSPARATAQGGEGEAEEQEDEEKEREHREDEEESDNDDGSTGGSGGTVNGTAQNCELALGGATQTFSYCSPIPKTPITLLWKVLPTPSGAPSGRRLRQGTSQVQIGFTGASDGQGYLSVGIPSTPGRMTGADAWILQDCSSCPTGASIAGYHLSGTDQSDVNQPSRMPATALTASRSAGVLSGSFVVELDASAAATPLIFAVGPLSSGGTPLRHDTTASADVALQSGSLSGVSVDGDSQTKKAAHAWLMTISWGVLIPCGIVMARCFKELDPFWFKFHRIIQSLGFVGGLAGLLVGFAIRSWSWETPYPVHRNLGIATVALMTMQMTALVLRPAKSHSLRRYWNWNHWWLGRAAAALAVANIYYGIIHVEELGTWAWAAYTAVLGSIVAVCVVKDGMDLYQGRRRMRFWGNPPEEEATGQAKLMTGPPSSPRLAGGSQFMMATTQQHINGNNTAGSGNSGAYAKGGGSYSH